VQVGKHDTIHALWEDSTETITEAVVSEAVLAGVETEVVLGEEDLLLVEAGVETEVTGLCSTLPAAIVENLVRYLSGPQTANRFIAAIVLKKWEMAAGKREGLMTGPVLLRLKADRI
jgi:hypothetical protein